MEIEINKKGEIIAKIQDDERKNCVHLSIHRDDLCIEKTALNEIARYRNRKTFLEAILEVNLF